MVPQVVMQVVMSGHQTGPRCRRISHRKTHTRFQAAIFLYCTPHNALGLGLHRQPSYNHYRSTSLSRSSHKWINGEVNKTQTDKTFVVSKHKFTTHFSVFWRISLKKCLSFSPFKFVKQQACFETFSQCIRNHTLYIFFILAYSPLPYLVISEIQYKTKFIDT